MLDKSKVKTIYLKHTYKEGVTLKAPENILISFVWTKYAGADTTKNWPPWPEFYWVELFYICGVIYFDDLYL